MEILRASSSDKLRKEQEEEMKIKSDCVRVSVCDFVGRMGRRRRRRRRIRRRWI